MTNTEFVTREEFVAAIDDLNRRVQGLYNLADRMGYTVDVPEGDSVPESQSDADAPSVGNNSTSAPTGTGSGVDYNAVAYGLSSLRTKMISAVGNRSAVDAEYTGTVAWFVACFAGDPSFDAAAFRRGCGI